MLILVSASRSSLIILAPWVPEGKNAPTEMNSPFRFTATVGPKLDNKYVLL